MSSNVYVIVWVIGITTAIAREQEKGTYDQFCVTPQGAMGACRAICIASLHRNDALAWINLSRILITGLLLFIFLMILMAAQLSQSVFDISQFLRLCLDITMLTAASCLDHVQTIVLGCLVAMLVPGYRRAGVDAPLLAVGVFMALQGIIFLANLVVVMIVIPALYQTLPITGWLAEISPPLLSLLAFYLIREAFNTAVWKTLAYQLNANSMEISPVVRSMA